ncbi:hypothetical protein [Mobilicoccus massiliensis]|uniref:hypothetical protein n=1 Tax=Mobilicoccus massiliensis TaxID=1522310 RepID=UPI001144640B|nr:hypothetical protein [Mobilicoccus massiliensis]
MSGNTKSKSTNVVEMKGRSNMTEDKMMTDWIKAYDEAIDKHNDLTMQHGDAELAVNAIEDAWERGEDASSAEDYAIAQADVKRLSSLLSAAKNDLANIERARPSDLRLAMALSEVVSNIFGETVKVARTDDGNGLTLVPSGQIEVNSGVLSGKVLLFRDAVKLSLGLDTEALDSALRAEGVFAEIRSLKRGSREGVQLDVHSYAPEGLPTVADQPDRDLLHALAESALKDAEAALLARDVPVALARDDRGRVLFDFTARHNVDVHNGDEVRTTVATFVPKLMGGYTDGGEIRRYTEAIGHHAAAFLMQDKGRAIPNLGVITAAHGRGFTVQAFTKTADER